MYKLWHVGFYSDTLIGEYRWLWVARLRALFTPVPTRID